MKTADPSDTDPSSDLIEREALAVLRKLQEIYCKNELYHQLEYIMGKPQDDEDYYSDVHSLIELYLEKVSEFKESHGRADRQAQEAFVLQALHDEVNGGDEEDAIPLESLKRLYHVLDRSLDANSIETGVAVGAREVAEAERRAAEEREATALAEGEKLTTSSGQRKAAMKVSPEEMFRMAQHVRSGLMDESELLSLRQEAVEETEVPIELNEQQPLFLKRMGLPSVRKKINYRAALPSEQLRNARTTQHRQAVQDRLQRQKEGDTSSLNSMQQAALRQLQINADRRMIHRREMQQQQQQQRQTEEEGELGRTRQGRGRLNPHGAGRETGGTRLPKKDLLHKKLPPWMMHSMGQQNPYLRGCPQRQGTPDDSRPSPLPILTARRRG
ncbi:pre-mRNA splicing factor ATP-dependent RNA helicase [Angomonas deanei]|nr:pre-mRNA splicing factor ATP-dependent RNA helicase [Angomonas deanei]|eukprot:EPY42632.1 pre-mRNA splicing factor ATP-dependent RNA helicase [Angomonas deanei]